MTATGGFVAPRPGYGSQTPPVSRMLSRNSVSWFTALWKIT